MKFESFVDVYPGLISWLDSDYNYIGVNKQLADLFGKKPKDFIGKPFGFLNKSARSEFEQIVHRFKTEGMKQFQTECTLYPHGEERIYWLSIHQYDTDNKILIVGLDITHQKTLENEVEESSLRLQRAGVMAELGEMSSGIAHEINNPLSIITMLATRAKKSISEKAFTPEKLVDTFDKILSTSERINKIIRGLKSMSRDGQYDPFEKVDLTQLTKEATEFCQTKLTNKGIDLKLELPNQPTFAECRSVQMTQTLVNLINNAIDAVDGTENAWIEIKLQDKKDSLSISITDSGNGIPFDLQERIMEPFFTTKPVGKGTGLGLSIVSAILADHNGNMRIDNNCKNTRFVISFPKKQPSIKPAEAA